MSDISPLSRPTRRSVYRARFRPYGRPRPIFLVMDARGDAHEQPVPTPGTDVEPTLHTYVTSSLVAPEGVEVRANDRPRASAWFIDLSRAFRQWVRGFNFSFVKREQHEPGVLKH